MTQGFDRVGHLLDELSRDWHVELTACERKSDLATGGQDNACVWRLTITSRRPSSFGAFTYVGDLASVVARAYAGERPDDRTR